jgi:hypothetical protein
MRNSLLSVWSRLLAAPTLLAFALGFSAACGEGASLLAQPPAVRFDGLGSHSRPISTRSADAQAFFDQGQAFLYGFNHDEAIRAFRQAALLDPQCPMPHWGIALANGPNINYPLVAVRSVTSLADAAEIGRGDGG